MEVATVYFMSVVKFSERMNVTMAMVVAMSFLLVTMCVVVFMAVAMGMPSEFQFIGVTTFLHFARHAASKRSDGK